jgi:hypothetical protein
MSKKQENIAERLKAYLTDFPRYAREVLRISTKKGQLVPFELNRAQRYVWSLIEEDRAAGKPVRMYILKGRQIGMSTLIQALAYWVCSMREHHMALVAAHEDKAATNLFQKSDIFYKSSPPEIRPQVRRSNREELYFANPDAEGTMGLESRIRVQTANNRNLGASMTLQFLHLSEFAKYESVLSEVKVAMATVLQTVARVPGTFVFLETTADGMGYGYEFWHADNNYRKVFVSWVADDEYTNEQGVLEAELDEADDTRWGNELWLRERILDELRRWYPERADDEDWYAEESLRRLAWRREMIVTQFNDDLALFRQEYPITADEAFLTSGYSVFDQRKVRDRIYALKLRDESGREWGLHHPPAAFRFDRDINDFYEARYGTLRVYEMPDKQSRYVIGADVAEGIAGGDDQAIQVLKLPDLLQVAVFDDPTTDANELADVLFHLGRIFNYAPINIEINGPGLATVNRLSKVLYYPGYLYQRETWDDVEKKYTKKLGWHTNRASKHILVTDLRQAVNEDAIKFRDILTLEQMTYYVKHKDGKLGAVPGEKDDLVMSLALALQMALDQGLLRMRDQGVVTPPRPAASQPYTFDWWAKKAHQQDGPAQPHSAAYYRQRFGRA